MTFWKRQSYKAGKQISGRHRFGERRRLISEAQVLSGGGETILCDTLEADTRNWILVKTHGTLEHKERNLMSEIFFKIT